MSDGLIEENAEEEAEKRACTVYFPKPDELTLDIDTEEAYQTFLRRFDELIRYTAGSFKFHELPSKSGLPHRHIVVTAKNRPVFSEPEKIALQFALGSDPVRETLNLWRHYAGIINPSKFFQPKETPPCPV